mmetsp:Transcript_2965/g.5217  ORF Transcript_2965/g.5217 Transcript_2965/m.5217 type:complete len:174 (-) Transcript_2965:899-1420(-)
MIGFIGGVGSNGSVNTDSLSSSNFTCKQNRVLCNGNRVVRAGSMNSERGTLHRRASALSMMAAGKAVEVSADEFATLVKENETVLVDFFAPWCGPCKLMAPLMDWAASTYSGKLTVVKIDTEKNPTFVKEHKIYGLPTLVVFKDGQSVAQVEGAMSKQAITDFLKQNAPGVVS